MNDDVKVNSDELKKAILDMRHKELQQRRISKSIHEFFGDVAFNLSSLPQSVTKSELTGLINEIAEESGDTYTKGEVKPFISQLLNVFDELTNQRTR